MKKSYLYVPVVLLILTLIGCTNDPSSAIVGTWQLEGDEGKMVAFRADGSLSTSDDGQTGSGKWAMPAEGELALEITTSGKSITFTCRVDIVDNAMVLTTEDGEVERYVRVS